jgi:8-oxo-dGTP pyrophosphatase MutT (NUDIX family)
MGFEPQKFFVGLVDFFSVLMPGALVAYLTRAWLTGMRYGVYTPLDGAESWMVFLFASYLLGHLVFLLGSALDEMAYDRVRKGTSLGQLRRLAENKAPSSSFVRRLARILFGRDPDAAVTQAQRLKARALAPLEAERAINAYQWCKARLSKDHPEALLGVHRFEADSKFFRSFCVVLVALAVFFVARLEWLKATASIAGVLAAFWRYVDQRFKATQQAYWSVIVLESTTHASATSAPPPTSTPPIPSPPVPSRPTRVDGLTHAGGIVFREGNGRTEFLLIQATKNRAEWVLPKGHIEWGEDPGETAVREVYEETGHWARIVRWVQDVKLGPEPDAPFVRFFLMETVVHPTKGATADAWPPEKRQQRWLAFTAAKQYRLFEETHNLLEIAEPLLPSSRAQVGEPPTREIQKRDRDRPHEVE